MVARHGKPGLVTAAEFLDVEVSSDGSVFASTANGIFYSADGTPNSFYQMTSASTTFGGGSGRIEIALALLMLNIFMQFFQIKVV